MRVNDEIIYSLVNVGLRVNTISCLVNIPLPITNSELMEIYDEFGLNDKRIEVANIQYSDSEEGIEIYNNYIRKNESLLTDSNDIEILSMIYESTNLPLKDCIEIYVNMRLSLISSEEYENIVTKKILEEIKTDNKAKLVQALCSDQYKEVLLSDKPVSDFLANLIVDDIYIEQVGKTLIPNYHVFRDYVLILDK